MKINRAIKAAIILLLCLLVSVILPSYCWLYSDMLSKIPTPTKGFTITAHTACENTDFDSLESIIVGLESGANAVEFDIRFLSDGTPILSHDETNKSIDSVTLEDALKLLTSYTCKINIDLKEISFLDKVEELVKLYGLEERSYFTGVSEGKIETVKRLAPNINFYLNISLSLLQKYDNDYITFIGRLALEYGAIGINLQHGDITKNTVALWHKQNLLVSVYTVNDNFNINKTLYNGVDNITSLMPSRVATIVNSL